MGECEDTSADAPRRSSVEEPAAPRSAFCCCERRMMDAGVAGDRPPSPPDRKTWAPLFLAEIAGDCVADAGFGGGPMMFSLSGSGEMDSAPELSCAPRGSSMPVPGCEGDRLDFCMLSSRSWTSLEGITLFSDVLRLLGFVTGECRTVAEDATERGAEAFLRILRAGSVSTRRRPWWRSMSTSTGDEVAELTTAWVCCG